MFLSGLFRRGHVGAAVMVMGSAILAGTLPFSAQSGAPDWRTPPARDFPLAGGNYANQRFSVLDKINRSNVQRLGGAWSLHLEEGLRGGELGNLDATPIVVDGVM